MKKILFCAVMCALMLTACGSKKTTYDFTGKMITPVQLGNVEYTEESTEKPVAILFREGNEIGGCLGCNFIAAGSYYVNEDTLTFSPLGITRALCDENSNMIESQMLEILGNVNKYIVEDDILSLYKDEELLGKFKFVEKPEGCCGGNGEHQCQHADGDHKCCQHAEGEHQCQHAEGEHQCKNAEKAQECAKAETVAEEPTAVQEAPAASEPAKIVGGQMAPKAQDATTKVSVQGPTSVKPAAQPTQSVSVKKAQSVNATQSMKTPKN